jgi:hypothetical protein
MVLAAVNFSRLVSVLPVTQGLQLLEMVRNSLKPVQTETAATAP